MRGFQAPNPSLFFSRRDPQDPRLGDLAQAIHKAHSASELTNALPLQPATIVAGYPDDEGIQINGGRIGAKSGPDAIRKCLYKMTPALKSQTEPQLSDIGNLMTIEPLEKRHETARAFAHAVLKAGHRWLSLGGGHDYAYPDAAAFCDVHASPLILNFDAHLDVRPTDRGLSSGTAFYRLLEEFPHIDFVEIGIQTQCNSTRHLDWLTARNARVVLIDSLLSTTNVIMPLLDVAGDLLEFKRPTFISIDVDVFDSSYAPGCSQSWPVGLHPHLFMRLFQELLTRLNVQAVGIYEVSPALDFDDCTSKLAALIIHRWIYHA